MKDKKTYLVTGGAGGVGTNLVERLVKDGHEVVSWDNYSVGIKDNHVEGASYFNIDTAQSSKEMVSSFDLVYHLGEYSKITPSFNEVKKVFDFNILGSFKLLEACVASNTPIVYAGSSTRLTYPGELHSPYAFFKSTVAKLIQGYGDWFNLKYNICYFYNVYGPKTDLWGNEWKSVVNIFKDQKAEGIPLTITGDGTQRRDFTYVDDIVNGLILAGGNLRNDEFSLGTGVDYSILEIAKAFNHPYEFIPPRRGDRPKGLANISHAKKILGYKPTMDVVDYIKSS